MLLTDLLLAPLQPRRRLARLSSRGEAAALAVVVASGIISTGLQLAAGGLEPRSRATAPGAGTVISLLLVPLLVAFWLASTLLIDTAARIMGASPSRGPMRRLGAFAFPVLVVYALVTLAQAGLDRAGGTAASLSLGVGLLNLAVLFWFIAVSGVAVHIVYGLPPPNAALAALFPYAALSGLLFGFVVIASILHVVGLI
ncbi:MAG: hypothetical protein NVSMB29_10370 [Candidatus Dormibacteria bacterium]